MLPSVPPPHEDLAQRIWSHRFEFHCQARDFISRLAMEQGWSRKFATQALEEYRKFCFLACVSNHPITPSEQVDAVWHLHLRYTRDYWLKFCPQVLRRDFHHGPTQGGRQEQQRFYEQYSLTLQSYRQFFGTPPVDFWPSSVIRFRPSVRSRWVYLPDFWVIRKPAWLKLVFSRKIKKDGET